MSISRFWEMSTNLPINPVHESYPCQCQNGKFVCRKACRTIARIPMFRTAIVSLQKCDNHPKIATLSLKAPRQFVVNH